MLVHCISGLKGLLPPTVTACAPPALHLAIENTPTFSRMLMSQLWGGKSSTRVLELANTQRRQLLLWCLMQTARCLAWWVGATRRPCHWPHISEACIPSSKHARLSAYGPTSGMFLFKEVVISTEALSRLPACCTA